MCTSLLHLPFSVPNLQAKLHIRAENRLVEARIQDNYVSAEANIRECRRVKEKMAECSA